MSASRSGYSGSTYGTAAVSNFKLERSLGFHTPSKYDITYMKYETPASVGTGHESDVGEEDHLPPRLTAPRTPWNNPARSGRGDLLNSQASNSKYPTLSPTYPTFAASNAALQLPGNDGHYSSHQFETGSYASPSCAVPQGPQVESGSRGRTLERNDTRFDSNSAVSQRPFDNSVSFRASPEQEWGSEQDGTRRRREDEAASDEPGSSNSPLETVAGSVELPSRQDVKYAVRVVSNIEVSRATRNAKKSTKGDPSGPLEFKITAQIFSGTKKELKKAIREESSVKTGFLNYYNEACKLNAIDDPAANQGSGTPKERTKRDVPGGGGSHHMHWASELEKYPEDQYATLTHVKLTLRWYGSKCTTKDAVAKLRGCWEKAGKA